MAVSDPIASPYFSVTCETEGVNYKYSTDDSEPSLVSEDLNSSGRFRIVSGSPMTIKIRAYKDGMEPSDIATCTYTPVTVPMALPDGSVLFYDRGSQYGEYKIEDDGYPVRCDGAVDDGTYNSQNWRYLICDKSDLDNKQWGPSDVHEEELLDIGIRDTDLMISRYSNNESYCWKLIKDKRDNTGFDWFMPSVTDCEKIFNNMQYITDCGGDVLSTSYLYWTCEQFNTEYADCFAFSIGNMFGNPKSDNKPSRLLRRI